MFDQIPHIPKDTSIMSYLLTNASALTALQNLTMTQNSLSMTQSELSTGLAVQNASDNASYWSIAQTMSSDKGALGAVASSLKVSAQMVSNFTSAMTQAMSVVNNIKNDLAEAQTSGANLTQIGNDITNQQASLVTIANGSTFNGQNWMNGNNDSTGAAQGASIADSYTNAGGVGAISLTKSSGATTTTGTGDIDKLSLFTSASTTSASAAAGGILGAVQTAGGTQTNGGAYTVMSMSVSSATTTQNLQDMMQEVNAAYTSMENASAKLGSYSNTITQQQSFISSMQTNLTNGVGSLVDADMNQVSTRLQALQTQQQLGVQSLSIANQSSSMILKLFQ